MAKYTPGTYTGKARGVRGIVIVKVTFSESAITEIKIAKHEEIFGQAYGLATSPFEAYIPKIIEYQSLAVPHVVGAEVVCEAIDKSVAHCVKLAGGSVSALKATEVPKPPKKDDITIETDLVVMGSGIAGLSAAVEAKYCGADVYLIEKQGIIGGSSAISGGKIIAAGSKQQRAVGISDTPEMLFGFLKNAAGTFLDDARISYFCHNANKNLEWLEEQGFVVQDIEPPHASQLPWRVHNSMGCVGQSMGWGGGFMVPLNNKFLELGGNLLLNTALRELIVEDGRVVGAIAEDTLDGRRVTLRAKLGVVIATGGYAANRELVESRYPWMKGYYFNCPNSSQGDGAVAAEKIGARNYQHPYLQTMPLNEQTGVGVNEESGLIVTRRGARFCDEYQFHSVVGSHMAEAGSNGAWYLTCGEEPFELLKYAIHTPAAIKARSIAELAEKTGTDPETLEKTIERYNYLCGIKFDEDFQKPESELRPLNGPTYYALFLTAATSITFGGLQIDIAAHVLDNDGGIIPGLFAAGEVANTGNFGHCVPSCGYSIGHGLHFGRVAARSACGKALL